MFITELWRIGDYIRQGAEIKSSSKQPPLFWLSHEAKGCILLTKEPQSQSPGILGQLVQPWWHAALQPCHCALSRKCGKLPAAILLLGWNSTTKKVAGGTGLPWKRKHLIRFEGIFWSGYKGEVRLRAAGSTGNHCIYCNQVTSKPLEKACPMLRRGKWRHMKADIYSWGVWAHVT